MAMFVYAALCRVGYFYIYGSLAERLEGLKILYFVFSDVFGICIMQSKLARTELWTNRAAVKLCLRWL